VTAVEDARPAFPVTERPDAPAYLQRFREREAAIESLDGDSDESTPLYLRRFRAKRETLGEGPPVGLRERPKWDDVELDTTVGWGEVTRTKEIVPERREHSASVVSDIYLVRHGETQGYSTESGLTPLGAWQAHRRGQELARRVMNGHRVSFASADTNRARQTGEHARRGLLDQLELFGRTADVSEIEAMEEFRNFAVWTPEGFQDVTAAFRQYKREIEKYERVGLGDRPTWLVEIDRFWGIQQGGGDPITHWLNMPMINFEPPVQCVRRFWAGIVRLHRERPGETTIVTTHSGPIRAFATWAMGYDPGEPFNTEFVRVRLVEGGKSAIVLYRNRVQEVAVPELDTLPDWWHNLEGQALPAERRETVNVQSAPADAGAASQRSAGVPTVLWFEQYWKGLSAEVGGKGASLGEMTGAGMPVPPGFSVTTAAFRQFRDTTDINETIARLIHDLDVTDTSNVSTRCSQIRDAFMAPALPADLDEQIRTSYRELSARSGATDVPVAVRSSATSEDSPDASFAGEHDTYLWVRGEDAVIDAVRRCWASLFTDRATCYRVEMGYDHRDVEMCVVIQKMVRPIAAGVAFTLNPVDGDRSCIAIDSAWGFGEGVVSGEVTPDNFIVDKVMMYVNRREISTKEVEFRLSDHDSVEKVALQPDRATAPSVTDPQILAIAALAKRAEKHYGCPQDIEWAVDMDLPEGENVVLLQARPETVWSKKSNAVLTEAPSGDFMSSIVSTLMSPLHTRNK